MPESQPSPARAPSLRQIASECGISTTAVSDALRGRKNISSATRLKVHEVATRIGYATDPRLSQLMSYLRQRKTIRNQGTLVWINSSASDRLWHTQPYKIGFLEGARQRALALGFAFDEIWAGDPKLNLKRLGQILEARRIDGLVIPTLKWNGDEKKHMAWGNYAAAYVDTTVLSPALSCVSPDYGENLRLALLEILRLGYTRIGFKLSPFIDDVSANQYSGMYLFERAHRRLAQIPLPELETDKSEKFEDWVRTYRPDAIICNEGTCIADLKKMGLRVPQDVAVAHLNLCADVAGWAGVDQNHQQLGASGVDIVIAQLHRDERGVPDLQKHITLRGKWSAGWTCPPRTPQTAESTG